jgi:hypothetical protein
MRANSGRQVVRVAVWVLLMASLASPQNKKASGAQDLSQGTKKKSGDVASAGPVTMRCLVTESGHRWNINATNTTSTIQHCAATCKLKTSTGNTTNGSCKPDVPGNANDLQVCSVYDKDLIWTVSEPVSYSCRAAPKKNHK